MLAVINITMKATYPILILTFLVNLAVGQKVYRANNEAFKANKFFYEFYFFNDSTCFLKGKSMDNSNYFIYHGKLARISDSLCLFKYKPIVEFGSCRRFDDNDSTCFYLTQIDTTLSIIKYKIRVANEAWQLININSDRTTLFVKGISKHDFTIDTKFIDPMTKDNIYLTINPLSDPVLTYYGSSTESSAIKISIVMSKLTIYPDQIHIWDKETFTQIK